MKLNIATQFHSEHTHGTQRLCFFSGALPKPRGVPDNERIKDTKTLDYASTPPGANILLCVVPAIGNFER
ncbi:MAG: hypothetical protein ACK5BJ_01905 [Bacteroidota bacterium]